MFNIDKEKFGAFIAMLRREKGITQKNLAQQLAISDKAVSKWETGVSVPGIDLLVPLANILGVTVTELLMCRRMEQDNALSATQVEQVVKTAISYSGEKPARAYRSNGKWGLIFIFFFIISCLEVLLCHMIGCVTIGLTVSIPLGVSFGIYFCFFAREKLPDYYDENRICAYTDGLFEMNLPGLRLNNSNWGKILKAGRIWAITLMLGYPIISYIEALFFTGIGLDIIDLFVALAVTLAGFFIPIYMAGKKYE